ncbi:MAG: 50S ribosomal protein L10 [Nitrospirota bacterium]
MNKNEKQELIDELRVKFEAAKAAIVTEYKGLTVSEITEFRNELRKNQLEYRVVKNTLAIRAAAGTSAQKLSEYLQGPTGLVLGFGDPVAPAKAVTEFAKKRDKLKVKIGIIEGQLASANELKAIAALPSREQLLSQMAAGFQAPASKMVRLLNATVARLGYALAALKEQKA